jgi:ferredoxin-NADP reductase
MTITQTIVREHEADLVVREAQRVADGVLAITLAAQDGAELPAWTPGAHIDFVLDDDLVRQYSLCGSPSKPEAWRVGVLRRRTVEVGRSGCTTSWLQARLCESGDRVIIFR